MQELVLAAPMQMRAVPHAPALAFAQDPGIANGQRVVCRAIKHWRWGKLREVGIAGAAYSQPYAVVPGHRHVEVPTEVVQPRFVAVPHQAAHAAAAVVERPTLTGRQDRLIRNADSLRRQWVAEIDVAPADQGAPLRVTGVEIHTH